MSRYRRTCVKFYFRIKITRYVKVRSFVYLCTFRTSFMVLSVFQLQFSISQEVRRWESLWHIKMFFSSFSLSFLWASRKTVSNLMTSEFQYVLWIFSLFWFKRVLLLVLVTCNCFGIVIDYNFYSNGCRFRRWMLIGGEFYVKEVPKDRWAIEACT